MFKHENNLSIFYMVLQLTVVANVLRFHFDCLTPKQPQNWPNKFQQNPKKASRSNEIHEGKQKQMNEHEKEFTRGA